MKAWERSAPDEASLIAAAVAGSDEAFRSLVEPHEGQLRAHCYRMLGSLLDADDALQETLIKAWRALSSFDGRSRIATWLYRIATTTCLNLIRGRSRRVLPIDQGFRSSDPSDAAKPPLEDSVWIEPFPDAAFGAQSPSHPEAWYELRESVELALVAAWQLLPPNQRAALLLTDVLGFPARDAAAMLDTTTGSLNSALQRARALVADRVPCPTQQANTRQVGDTVIGSVVDRFLQAMERADVGAVVGLLRADTTWSMPPQPAWFAGHEAIAAFLAENPFRYFRWKYLPTQANGQPALASYSWDDAAAVYLPHAIDVLTFQEDRISAVTTFVDVTRRGVNGPGFRSFADSRLFDRFDLPGSLPA